MSQTIHYIKLLENLSLARKITYNVNSSFCKTVIQDLKVQSYIFLSHAAIESYVEALALDTATKSIELYHNQEIISRPLIGLISSGLIARIEEKSLSKKVSEDLFQNIGEFSNVAFGRFKSLVGDNNGIKRDNLKKIFLPVGIDPEIEDPVVTAALHSFGGKRGAIAHGFKIAKAHTLSEIDSDIDTIKLGLVNYDNACVTSLNVTMSTI